MGNDLLAAIEESRITGSVSGALNSTFVALILKNYAPEDFNDYHLISLCNFAYKLISKIIATRLNSTLSKCMSPKQFRFLENKRILEVI